MSTEHFDTVIIGAGLSGIGMACQLSMNCPNKKFTVLERRQAMGGTWDLFRYPGIRSDSDMFTLGFRFRPWTEPKVLADGPSIKQYVIDTAEEYGVADKIQYGMNATHANWCSTEKRWTITVEHSSQEQAEAEATAAGTQSKTSETRHITCNFLIHCSGYYKYEQGYQPDFPNVDAYQGKLIHPQHWPENLDYKDQQVVVIGSGATAVTLVPAMADTAAHVTMLQRSPSYIISLPAVDKITVFLKKILPDSWVFASTRWRNILITRWLYLASKKWPEKMKRFFIKGVEKQLPEDADLSHFQPNYYPWDQRVCAVPDGDLFQALNSGQASIVTDHIERFTETGLQLKSGKTLAADIIVSATGLNVELLGGMEVTIDGESRPHGELLTYKAVQVEGVPNLAVLFGYTNAPWTLKADIAAGYLCRLFKHMDEHGYQVAVPIDEQNSAIPADSALDSLEAGYVQRSAHKIPRQGRDLPWRVLNNYKRDKTMLLKEPVDHPALRFS